jgi:uncharacterized Tic20 family protein
MVRLKAILALNLSLYSGDICGKHGQAGSLAGAAYVLNSNARVLWIAQRERKSLVDQKGKSYLDFDFQYQYKLWKYGLSIL